MNKEEYIEMRQEFASLVYAFENFMKNGFLADCKYNVAFYDNLVQIRESELRLSVIVAAMKDKENNTPIDQILSKIEKTKIDYNVEKIQTENKHKYCLQLIQILSKFDKSAYDASETHMKDFLIKYHPVVCLNAKKEAREKYEMLKRFYFECNFVGFQEFLNENIQIFETGEINEDRYVEASQVYFRFRQTITDSLNKSKELYPYNKIELFNDDMTIQAEKDNLDIKLKQLKNSLKAAEKDFKNEFGFDFKFADEK
jgi:hypothetical protein